MACQQVCTQTLQGALEGCKSAADPVGCAGMARIDQLKCNQQCVLNEAPALQVCNTNFNDCLQSCASARQ